MNEESRRKLLACVSGEAEGRGFRIALELTRAVASGPKPKDLAETFVDLFELFEFGVDPRDRERERKEREQAEKEQRKTLEKAEKDAAKERERAEKSERKAKGKESPEAADEQGTSDERGGREAVEDQEGVRRRGLVHRGGLGFAWSPDASEAAETVSRSVDERGCRASGGAAASVARESETAEPESSREQEDQPGGEGHPFWDTFAESRSKGRLHEAAPQGSGKLSVDDFADLLGIGKDET